jgi:2'-5' RNA ligase
VSSFLCLLPTGAALEPLRRFERPEHAALRWEPERRWHVTLRYCPQADEATLGLLAAAADEVAGALDAPAIELGPATERLGRDGTLVVPARGAEAPARLVDEALGGALGEPAHPFVGHLTLARLRGRAALPEELVGRALEASFVASAIFLVESNPGPEGSVYEVRHRAPFDR